MVVLDTVPKILYKIDPKSIQNEPPSGRRSVTAQIISYLLQFSQLSHLLFFPTVFSHNNPSCSKQTETFVSPFKNQSLENLRFNSFPPIHSSTPYSWLLSSPIIQFNIAKVPKFNNLIYRKHITKLITQLADHILYFTNASKNNQRQSTYILNARTNKICPDKKYFASIYSAKLNLILAILQVHALSQPYTAQ